MGIHLWGSISISSDIIPSFSQVRGERVLQRVRQSPDPTARRPVRKKSSLSSQHGKKDRPCALLVDIEESTPRGVYLLNPAIEKSSSSPISHSSIVVVYTGSSIEAQSDLLSLTMFWHYSLLAHYMIIRSTHQNDGVNPLQLVNLRRKRLLFMV